MQTFNYLYNAMKKYDAAAVGVRKEIYTNFLTKEVWDALKTYFNLKTYDTPNRYFHLHEDGQVQLRLWEEEDSDYSGFEFKLFVPLELVESGGLVDYIATKREKELAIHKAELEARRIKDSERAAKRKTANEKRELARLLKKYPDGLMKARKT